MGIQNVICDLESQTQRLGVSCNPVEIFTGCAADYRSDTGHVVIRAPVFKRSISERPV